MNRLQNMRLKFLPGLRYRKIYGNFWGELDRRIISLIIANTYKDARIFECGFGGGHFLACLHYMGYEVFGTEVRPDAYMNTCERFEKGHLKLPLYDKDIFDIREKYDVLYSTGLIQALAPKSRAHFLKHISTISKKTIYVVPKIIEDRNINSNEKIAVAGCAEYCTSTLAYELSSYYSMVKCGEWTAQEVGMEDDFLWYVCEQEQFI